MADIFVSYSRHDEQFGRKLHARLTGIKRDVWMDWEDIPFNSDWWQEIKRGIETSDNFLIILSNDFVKSPVCMLEVDYARQNNKRILVIAHNFDENEDNNEKLRERTNESGTVKQLLGNRDIVALSRENWTTIGHVNWLFFGDDNNFEDDFHNLIETLDTDLNHVRTHTNLQVTALEWDTNERNWSFLLTGIQIDQAEAWLQAADTEDKAPKPTTVQRDFIAASREQQIAQENSIKDMQMRARRFRRSSMIAGGFAALMVVIALGLTYFTGQTLNTSRMQLTEAEDQVGTANIVALNAGGTLTSIPPTIDENNTRVASIGETLTPIAGTLEGAEAERQAAQELAFSAQTDVVSASNNLGTANAALTPVAVTLTQSADDQATANALVGTAGADSMTAQAQVIDAGTRAADAEVLAATANSELEQANATLSPIAPTLTQASDQIRNANAASTESAGQLATATVQIGIVSTEIADANILVAEAKDELTQIIPTLNQASTQASGAETQVAFADTEIANVGDRIATADTRNQTLSSTAEAIRRDAEINRQEAQSQALIVNAEQASQNGDIDLALALILESYEINPSLPQTRRLLNSLAYSSARFILDGATFATFSPDSKWVAYGFGKEIIILDIDSREVVTRLTGHSDTVVDGEFSTLHDIFVSGSLDTDVIVWDTRTWDIVTVLSSHEQPITDIDLDNQGKQIAAVAEDDIVFIWDSQEDYEETIYDFDDSDTTLNRIAFYGNGTRFLAWGLVGPDEVQYRVNMTGNQAPVRRFDQIYTVLNPAYDLDAGHTINSAMIESETYLNIYSLTRPGDVVQFATGFNWTQGEDIVEARAFSSSGSDVVTGIRNQREGTSDIILMNTGQRERSSALVFDGEATRRVTALAFSPDGNTVLSGYGTYLVLWDIETGREIRRFGAHLDDIVGIIYSRDSNFAITQSRDGNYRVWDVSFSDPAVLRTIEIPNNSGVSPANPGLSPDNSDIFFNIASDIYRYSRFTGRQVLSTFSFFGLQDMFYSPVETYAITTAADTPNVDPNVFMWDLSQEEPNLSLWADEIRPDNDGIIDPVGVFSNDGRQVALAFPSFVHVYDVTTPSEPQLSSQLDRNGMQIGAFTFSPDGRYLYAVTNQVDGVESYALVTWDLNKNTMQLESIPHIRPVNAMDVSNDGTQIITASQDQTVVLLDAETGSILRRMVGHQSAVNDIYFGLADEVALSASDDGTMILWDLETGQSIRRYVTGTPISGLYLSNDSKLAVTTDSTNNITVWQIETLDDVVDWVLENREIRSLTNEQCRQFELSCDD